jgi:predicted kinase
MNTLDNEALTLPRRSLIVLCGPAGAGKSTVASAVLQRNGLAATTAVSSDACRLMLCDDISSVTADQWAMLQPKTFHLFLTIIGMRLSIGRPAIADGVNLYRELRAGLLDHARTHNYYSALVVFDLSLATCLAQNAQRPESHRLPEGQIRAQRQFLDDLLPHLTEEGWDRVMVLNEQRRTVPLDLSG